MNTTTTAYYCRTSTEEQKKGKTIESQIAEIKQFAEDNNYSITDKFIDEAWSGSVLERPELDRLRTEVKLGKFNTLLIHHPDRLSRVQIHQLLLLDEFEKNNIKVVFVKIPEFSTQSEESRVVNKSVWSMVSELERLRIRERTRRGRRNKANKGLIVGGPPPYGYLYIKKNKEEKKEGYYKINHEEARIVRMIFDWVKQGYSERGVVRKLTEQKIPRRKQSKNPRRPIWIWAKSTVHKILTNRTYTGITFYNKHKSVIPKKPINTDKYKRTVKTSRIKRSKEEWIPINLSPKLQIVSQKDFNFVQKQLKKNSTHSLRNTKNKYLLRNLIKCDICGCNYYANSSHGKPNYRCSNKNKQFPLPKTCTNVCVNATVIEPLVWSSIKQAVMNPNTILKQTKLFETNHEAKKDDECSKILSRLENEETRLIQAYRKGIIELEQLEDSLKDIKLRKSTLNVETQKTKTPPVRLLKKGVRWLCKEIFKTIEEMNFEEKKRFLQLLVDEIILNKKQITIRCVLPVYNDMKANRLIAPTTSEDCVRLLLRFLKLFWLALDL